MITTHRPLLVIAAVLGCVFAGHATYAQNVNVPREPTTRDTDSPKPPSAGTRALQHLLEALTKIVCERAGNCPQITETPSESPSPDPQAFGDKRTRPAGPRNYGPASPNFSFHTPPGWQAHEEHSSVTIAPSGEYLDGNLTNGVIFGLSDLKGASFESGTDRYMRSVLSANKYLRRTGRNETNVFNGIPCNATRLIGQSPQTGHTENVIVYTCQRNTQLFYVVNVNSGPNAGRFEEQNNRVIQSIKFR